MCEEWDFSRGVCKKGQLKAEILTEGEGKLAEKGNYLTLHYTGTLLDGKKFDSSVDRNQPFSFVLGQGRVIQGWEMGVLGMKKGEKRRLTISPELAYGKQGAGDIIPPDSILIFEIELLEIN
ncbi:MAG: FKBP-type peptidyl-prolyl cis-trans isomerase [Candidatus Pacebacteria bacterium]|nr:FKBP-type peptidyl-prolyl cis-trans isomerase [Candidatus Paceibacterota bacterium]MDD3072618.1 FKBP-type peptidyl-prolyl cis-trans isomerase [Candidatus Paceibacterota bacterium]MDD3728944.1 FKBP-type peptidyl-prolyl cis-trans isomerase [Candidatus Paceibacterota bacterium]MDD4201560.1 FKBP-type peptidyl-prolyl cis-trans isomerase [Candidatus Paceibacterota bacterium]MDD4467182.1 FKBP-type peptidyl-prolyl cis-trans isomerase [Candidatus Paceibacterota bacterium]